MLFLVILLLVLVSVGLVAASPWALSALDHNGNRINWSRLSEIGATYGAVSAIIAAIVLLGVAASLVIQSREAKAARGNAQRAHQVDLLRMATEDPRYMECGGPYLTENFDTECQYVYVNLIVTQWHYEYKIGEMTDVLLRATAMSVFASSPGRQYWEASGSFWRDNYSGRRARRFFRILDEAYQEAAKNPSPSPPPAVNSKPPSCSESPQASRWWWLLAAGCGPAVTMTLYTARQIWRHVRARRR
ncbi:MAG: DUF6082 family protein [Pseudonocardiaceae bacterium]